MVSLSLTCMINSFITSILFCTLLDFLPRLFQLLHNENLIDKSAYREWSNDKRTNGAASAAVTRFFKTVLQI